MSIVVGIDGSEGSEHALAWAIGEARRRNTNLELVHGWRIALGAHTATAPALALLPAAAQALTDRVLAGARAAAPGLDISARAIESGPVHALVDAAAAAEMLVVGSHGRGRIASALVGSVADGCVRSSTVPVTVIRPSARERGDAVVVGVDGSATSLSALRVGAIEAGVRSAELVVLMAWHPPAGLNDFGTTAVIADEDWEADARALLEHTLSSAGGPPATPRLARGPAAEALLDASRAAAMVIVGSRGLGGLGAALLGSVSRRLVHEAEVPVMVVPDDGTC